MWRYRDSPTGPWRDLPPLLDTIPGSEALKIRLDSLHGQFQGSIEYRPTRPSVLPAITGLAPGAIDEGATAAVLVTGRNFVPGVSTVSVRQASGAVESRVQVRTVHVTADGTKLGVTLKAGVMTDLAEGDVRILSLRITTPAGSAEHRLDILGHDELDVQGAVTLQQSRGRRRAGRHFAHGERHAGPQRPRAAGPVCGGGRWRRLLGFPCRI